jgi:uncharacterized protein (DUF58 family)
MKKILWAIDIAAIVIAIIYLIVHYIWQIIMFILPIVIVGAIAYWFIKQIKKGSKS